MSYNALLNQVIAESQLPIKEIAARCAEQGVEVTPAYISTLKNDSSRIPSDKISRSIAIACGKPENLLVIEAYLEKAPQEVTGMLETLRDKVFVYSLGFFANAVEPAIIDAMKQKYRTMPMAKFIQEVAEYDTTQFEKLEGAFNVTSLDIDEEGAAARLEMATQPGIEVKDDAMFPTIPQGSSVILQLKELGDYKNGDILCFKKNDDEELHFRQVTFLNDKRTKMMMGSFNNAYPAQVVDIADIVIVGKVVQLMADFD